METKFLNQRDAIQPLTPAKAILAVLPFLAFGICSLVERWGFSLAGSDGLPFWQVYWLNPYLMFNYLNLIGLGAGIVAGFPRWAYPYLGWAVLFVWWWSDMSFSGFVVGVKIYVPLLGVILIGLLIRRSIEPLKQIVRGIWHEWTMFSLAVFILYSFVYMIFDENHHPLLYLLMTMTALAVSVSAWGYFRARLPMWRVLSLIGGLAVATAISGYSYATWDYRAYYGLPPSTEEFNLAWFIFMGVLLLIVLGNGLLAHWRQMRAQAK